MILWCSLAPATPASRIVDTSSVFVVQSSRTPILLKLLLRSGNHPILMREGSVKEPAIGGGLADHRFLFNITSLQYPKIPPTIAFKNFSLCRGEETQRRSPLTGAPHRSFCPRVIRLKISSKDPVGLSCQRARVYAPPRNPKHLPKLARDSVAVDPTSNRLRNNDVPSFLRRTPNASRYCPLDRGSS